VAGPLAFADTFLKDLAQTQPRNVVPDVQSTVMILTTACESFDAVEGYYVGHGRRTSDDEKMSTVMAKVNSMASIYNSVGYHT